MKRRSFLKNISAASVMMGGFPVSVLAGNQELKKIAASSDNENVLIFVQLHGGNDGLNTLIPISQYNQYYQLRSNIAIPDSNASTSRRAILVDESVDENSLVGLHPDMIGFKELYGQGKGTIVQNVGYENMNLSHFRGRDIVFMGGGSTDDYHSGWMGRFLDHEYPGYPDEYLKPDSTMKDPIGIELGNTQSLAFHREAGIPIGFNVQSPQQFYDLITGVGVEPPILFPDSHAGDELRYLMEFERQSNHYAARLKELYEKGNNSPTVNYPEAYPLIAPGRFSHNPLSGQLKLIARLLSGGCKTRIFMCRMGLFDTHGDQVEKYDSTMGGHAALLYHLSAAIKAFQDDLAYLGLEEKVLTMTFTEFGRRAYSNASYGTDHGTATPVFLFGSGLKGGVVGNNPDLSDLQGGNLKYAIDYRQVYTSVVQDWFGASDEAMKATKFDQWVSQKIDLIAGSNNTGVDYRDSGKNQLFDCYPNPARSDVIFSFYLNKPSQVELSLYDVTGKRVKTLLAEEKPYGKTTVHFSVNNLSKGTYIYMLKVDRETYSKRLIVE